MDVVGGGVGLEAEVADDGDDGGGSLGRFAVGVEGGADGADDTLLVGGLKGVHRSVDLVLGEFGGRVGADQLGGAPQRGGDVGLEVGRVGVVVPGLHDVGPGHLPGVERSPPGVLVKEARGAGAARRLGSVQAGQDVVDQAALSG